MFENELSLMLTSIQEASDEVMRIYQKGFEVKTKEDHSPVTDADLASDKILRERLSVFSDVGWLSEEDKDDEKRFQYRKVFIVDPLDGTSDFVDHDDSFGINLALVLDGKPVVALVSIPAKNWIAYAVKGEGTYLVKKNNKPKKLHVSYRMDQLRYLVSRTHFSDEDLEVIRKNHNRIKEVVPMGASTKAVEIARGNADCCIRYTDKTKEWDVCAPDLIVREAGGIFVDTKGQEFSYNRKDVYNHDGYCMFNRKENMDLL